MVIEKEHPKGKLEKQTIHTGHLFTSLAFQKKGPWLTMVSLTANWFSLNFLCTETDSCARC